MIASGINLVMTVIGFAVSTMFIVFVCTRLICARIQLTASRRSFPAATRSDLGLLERGLHGLEPFVISSFPTRKFSHEFFSSSETTQCVVCLAEYQQKDILRILPYCGHTFHVTCIDLWLQQNSTCPVCRISLRDSPERKRVLPPIYSSSGHSTSSSWDAFHLHSYVNLFNSPDYLAQTLNSQTMETVQEDCNCPWPDRDVQSAMEGDHALKNVSDQRNVSEIKDMESPSNLFCS